MLIKMAHQNKRDKRKIDFFAMDSSKAISREKQKARQLRNSPWWKKKIELGICYYCGKKFSPSELTMDHKIPLSRGGMSEKINIVPACKECNNKKKYLLPTEWSEYMENLEKK